MAGKIQDMQQRKRDLKFMITAVQLTIICGYILVKYVFNANRPWNFFLISGCFALGSPVVWCWYHAIRGFKTPSADKQEPEPNPPAE